MYLLVVLSIFLPLAFNAFVQTGPAYFVALSGADTNPGTLAQPFKTINKAAAVVPAGGTVYVRGGVYRQAVDITRSGTAATPTRYLAYPGETPVIDGGNTLPTSYKGLLNISGNWNIVGGFEVTGSAVVGIAAYGQHNVIRDSYVHHTQKSGIGLYGDYNTAEHNRVWRASMSNEYGSGPNYSTGITASRDQTDGLTQHSVIRNNTVWEVWGQGITTHQSDSTLIEGNVSHDNWANNYYLNDTQHTVLTRNLSYFDPASDIDDVPGALVGILMGDEKCQPCSGYNTIINNISIGGKRNFDWHSGVSDLIHDTMIANNTFVNSKEWANVQFNQGQAQNVVFENNVIVQDTEVSILRSEVTGATFRNNIWSRSPGSTYLGAGSLVANPLLQRSGTPYDPDWHRLQPDSPARGRASALPEVSTDYFGAVRPADPDMGAIQN